MYKVTFRQHSKWGPGRTGKVVSKGTLPALGPCFLISMTLEQHLAELIHIIHMETEASQ